MRLSIIGLLLFPLARPALAQTDHPLLLRMLDNAEAVEYGSYRITASEQYPYSKDTIFYRAHGAFSRFEHFDGKPGIRYEVELETQFPSQTNYLRSIFDGRIKHDMHSDTLVLLYDTRQLGNDYELRGLKYVFFIPLLLHPEPTRKYFGPDKVLGIPPYQTLGDTLIGDTPCTLVGADWAPDTAGLNWQHIRFGISKRTGLPIYFYHTTETRTESEQAAPQKHRLEILVEEWSQALPINSFYLDWPSLPSTYEVRTFYDCYNREIVRPRSQPGL